MRTCPTRSWSALAATTKPGGAQVRPRGDGAKLVESRRRRSITLRRPSWAGRRRTGRSPCARNRRRRHPVGGRGQGQAHRPRSPRRWRWSSATRAATTPATPSSSTASASPSSCVPSGVLYDHVTPVIGNGVVVDPGVLLAEIDRSQAGASTARRLKRGRQRPPDPARTTRRSTSSPSAGSAATSWAPPGGASARPTPTRRCESGCGCRTSSTRRSSGRSWTRR